MENKTLEVNKRKYSKTVFKGYKHRAQVHFNLKGGDYHNLDIYTTDTDKESVFKVLNSRIKGKVKSIEITHWCTREQDDASAEMIEELFSDLEKQEQETNHISKIDFELFLDACTSSGCFIKTHDNISLSHEVILELESLLDRYNDTKAKAKIKKLIKSKNLFNIK